MRQGLCSLGAAVLAILSTSPAYAAKTEVRYMTVRPPDVILEDVTRLAVLDFSGPLGRRTADTMVEALVRHQEFLRRLEWDPEASPRFLEVIERDRLHSVLAEHDLGEAGVVEESEATRLGGILGVEAIVVGSAREFVDDTHEDRQESYVKGGQQYTRTVRYYTREATLKADVRVLDAASGRVLTSFGTSETRTVTDNDFRNLTEARAMYDGCALAVGHKLAIHLIPSLDPQRTELHKVKSKDKEVKRLASEAADLAEAGQIDQAWRALTVAREHDPYNADLLYNLGILHEAADDYDEARGLFEGARQLDAKENDFLTAIARIDYEISARDQVARLGFVPATTGFDAGAADEAIAAASVPRVRVKKKTATLYAEPRESSRVLVELPKSMELEVVGNEVQGKSTFLKVKTFDGREGWVAAADVEDQ